MEKFFWDKTSSHFEDNTLAFNLLILLCQKRAEFISAIWGISLQLSNQNTELSQLAELVTLISSKSLVQKHKLLENLPENLIHKSNLMDQQQIDKKFARAYTKTYFEQKKYSLIKENN